MLTSRSRAHFRTHRPSSDATSVPFDLCSVAAYISITFRFACRSVAPGDSRGARASHGDAYAGPLMDAGTASRGQARQSIFAPCASRASQKKAPHDFSPHIPAYELTRMSATIAAACIGTLFPQTHVLPCCHNCVFFLLGARCVALVFQTLGGDSNHRSFMVAGH